MRLSPALPNSCRGSSGWSGRGRSFSAAATSALKLFPAARRRHIVRICPVDSPGNGLRSLRRRSWRALPGMHANTV